MNFLLASHRLGQVRGIDIRIAYSLYMIIAIFALPSFGRGAYGQALGVLCLPVFVLLHELGHSFAAQWLGVKVRRITLHMLGGAAELAGIIPGPKAEIFVALAGPAVSFALAAGSFLLYFLLPGAPGVVGAWLEYCFFVNVMLVVFNLLPVFPMDGGRVALAAAILWRGVEGGIALMRPISAVGAGLIALFGLYEMMALQNPFGIFMILIAGMLYFQGGQEMQARLHAERYSGGMGWSARDSSPGGAGRTHAFGNGFGNPNDPSNSPWLRPAQARVIDDESQSSAEKKTGWFAGWREKRRAQKTATRAAENAELNRLVDDVLKKVNADGIASLTPGERALLMRASEHYHKKG